MFLENSEDWKYELDIKTSNARKKIIPLKYENSKCPVVKLKIYNRIYQ